MPANRGLSPVCLLIIAVLTLSTARAAEYIRSESTAPTSVEDLATPLDTALEKPEVEIKKILLDGLKRRLEKQPAWLRDLAFDYNLRSYYFKRDNPDGSINEALTLGGEIEVTTGTFARIARVGLSYFVSHGLDAPADRGGSGLLGPNQENLGVLGQAYLELGTLEKFGGHLYRQALELPYINKDDGLMLPNTHEGYVAGRRGTGNDFIFGHITKIKKRDSESFIPMSEAAGAARTDKGVTLVGGKLRLGKDTNVAAFNLYGWDTYNTAYIEGKFIDPVLGQYGVKVSAQYSDQRSVGDALVGDFDTNAFGLSLAASRHGVLARLAYTQVSRGGDIRSPWGGRPSYNEMMLGKFSRAGEKALRLGLSWSGKRQGRAAWSGFANITTGWDAIDEGTGQELADSTEYDLTVDYKPTSGSARGLWFRMRGAYLDFDDGTDQWNVRLILNYPFNFL